MKFVITGGRGALGSRITRHLREAGNEVVVLTRTPVHPGEVEWDAKTVGPWVNHLEGAIIINLAGQLVDRRPTKTNIELLRSSRVNATLALKQAMIKNGWTTPLWLQMSSLAIYGDGGEAILDESAEPIRTLPQMTDVAKPWEAAAAGAPAERMAILRTGIVLDTGVPAMDRLTGMTKLGLGGRIASGKQWISWVHIADFIAAIEYLITNAELSGVVHITSPQPVHNSMLMHALRKQLHRPPAVPTPTIAVKLGAFVLGSDPALALTGRRCIPQKLTNSGFEFCFPEITAALADLL